MDRDRKLEVTFVGVVIGVSPRVRMYRSFDERSEEYFGHVVRLVGDYGGDEREFSIAIGKVAQAKHRFRVGDRVRGRGSEVEYPEEETADLYTVSGIQFEDRGPERGLISGPPFHGVAPPPDVYEARGPRRLASASFKSKCSSCMWACEMPVEIMIDKWDSRKRKHRRETFCFGPKTCPVYMSGPPRNVPGRKGMIWTEEDWVDEEATAQRSADA